MNTQETPTKPEQGATSARNEPSYMNVTKSQKRKSVDPTKRDVITPEDLPNPIFRFAVTLAVLLPLLFVVAIYYGIINP
jgi:hypothetical protein